LTHLTCGLRPGLTKCWNLQDIREVEREFRVYDGTLLDYALRLDGKPRLFVEAKAMTKSLDDKTFIAQTVNYANNEGVVWCVLTNGLVYRVYKTNEPVGMAQKLLFEVDLRDAAADAPEVLKPLGMLSREAVEAGRLDDWGEQVFADGRVRAALSHLAANPPRGFLKAVSGALAGPAIGDPNLRASLGRILGQGVSRPPVSDPSKPTVPPASKKTTEPPPSGGYDVAWHKRNIPAAMADLFDQLDSLGRSLGADVVRRPQKIYVGYFAGKRSFFSVRLQKAKLILWISIPPAEAKPWDPDVMRDVSNIGHYGMGDLEYTLASTDQLPQLESLLQDAFARSIRSR
jgi:predicted transport protein